MKLAAGAEVPLEGLVFGLVRYVDIGEVECPNLNWALTDSVNLNFCCRIIADLGALVRGILSPPCSIGE